MLCNRTLNEHVLLEKIQILFLLQIGEIGPISYKKQQQNATFEMDFESVA
jgi:hypothetical protein